MKSKEALNKICLECQLYKGKMQVACPFRSISNDYCNEYEQIEKDLEVLKILKQHIKEINYVEYLLQGEPRYVYYVDLLKKNLTKEEYDLLKEWYENDKISKNNN